MISPNDQLCGVFRKKGAWNKSWKIRKYIVDPTVEAITYFDPNNGQEKGKISVLQSTGEKYVTLEKGDSRNVTAARLQKPAVAINIVTVGRVYELVFDKELDAKLFAGQLVMTGLLSNLEEINRSMGWQIGKKIEEVKSIEIDEAVAKELNEETSAENVIGALASSVIPQIQRFDSAQSGATLNESFDYANKENKLGTNLIGVHLLKRDGSFRLMAESSNRGAAAMKSLEETGRFPYSFLRREEIPQLALYPSDEDKKTYYMFWVTELVLISIVMDDSNYVLMALKVYDEYLTEHFIKISQFLKVVKESDPCIACTLFQFCTGITGEDALKKSMSIVLSGKLDNLSRARMSIKDAKSLTESVLLRLDGTATGVASAEEIAWLNASTEFALFCSLNDEESLGLELVQSTTLRFANYFGSDDAGTLKAEALLAIILSSQGEIARAEAVVRGVLAARLRVCGGGNSNTLKTRILLGHLLHSQDKHQEAEEIARNVLSIAEETLGANDLVVSLAMDLLGLALITQGEYVEAENILKRSLHCKESVFGLTRLETLRTIQLLLVITHDNTAKLVPLAEKAVICSYNSFGETNERTRLNMALLASLLVAIGPSDYPRAEQLFVKSLMLDEEDGRSLHRDKDEMLQFARNYAGMLVKQKKYQQAESVYLKVHEASVNRPERLKDFALTTLSLGTLYYTITDLAGAQKFFKVAADVFPLVCGADSKEAIFSKRRYEFVTAELQKVS